MNQFESAEFLDLDAALLALAKKDESLLRTVELLYFAGMTANEAAQALGRSVHVVRHNLRTARSWLRWKLTGNAGLNSVKAFQNVARAVAQGDRTSVGTRHRVLASR
jgi:hypothetical protein